MGIYRVSIATLETNGLGAMYVIKPLRGIDLIYRSKCPNRYQIDKGREARSRRIQVGTPIAELSLGGESDLLEDDASVLGSLR